MSSAAPVFAAGPDAHTGLSADHRLRARRLLILRFTLLNLVAAAFLATAVVEGSILALFDGPAVWMSWAIVAVFVVGLIWCARLCARTSAELDQLNRGVLRRRSRPARWLAEPGGAEEAEKAITIELRSQSAGVRYLAGLLVLLGLVGTVLGLKIAFDNASITATGDLDAAAEMFSTVMGGVGLALSTTLLGVVGNIWLTACWRLLEHGEATLLATILRARGRATARERGGDPAAVVAGARGVDSGNGDRGVR